MRRRKYNKLICIDDTTTKLVRIGDGFTTQEVKIPEFTYGRAYSIIERVSKQVVTVLSDDNRIVSVWVGAYSHRRFRPIYYTNKLKIV